MTASPRPTVDPALVERARSGDLAACGRLVEATEPLVRNAVRRLTADAALADDAVQETYVRAFAALRSLRDPAAFPAWLARVAVSTARNEIRRRRGVVVDPAHLDALPAREAAGDDARLQAALRRALVALPAAERRICEHTYLHGRATADLAAELGVTEAALRKRLQRARDRLRKEMEMTLSAPEGGERLSDKIVDLLSRPSLLGVPENPVGAVWERILALHPRWTTLELQEELTRADVASAVGEEHVRLPCGLHRIDDERFLRHDLSVPMLLAARGRPLGARLLAAGQVYRDDPVDRTHLQAFHQAEFHWTGRGLTVFDAMESLSALLDDLLPGCRLRIEEMDYGLFADRGWEFFVRHDGGWISVAGCARFADRVVDRLGLDPATDVAVGTGLGLERVASLRYGIDDLRRIESERV